MRREMYYSWQRNPDIDPEVLQERALTQRCELLIQEKNQNKLECFLGELYEIEPCCSEGANIKIIELINRVEMTLSDLRLLVNKKSCASP